MDENKEKAKQIIIEKIERLFENDDLSIELNIEQDPRPIYLIGSEDFDELFKEVKIIERWVFKYTSYGKR